MTPRRRFALAYAAGALPGLAVATWLLLHGRLELFGWRLIGSFYDAQAHRFLEGGLAVDPAYLGLDGFRGRSGVYLYQGPVPALLRLPAAALFGDRYDGRLGQLSMLVAFALLALVAGRLHWRVRRLVRGEVRVGRAETLLVGVFAFVVSGGSVLVFLASRAWVYHEAIIWGAALSLAALDQLVALVRRPSAWGLARVSALTAAALLTRASVALGPLAGLALVAVGVLAARSPGRLERALGWLGPGRRGRPLPVIAYATALTLPLAAYAALNQVKFGQLFGVPFRDQVFTEIDPARQAILDANGGTLFGLQFVPTTVWHYLRPDGIELTATFPFVDFRPPPGTVVGDVVFDLVDRAASLPASMPFLLALAAVGAALTFRRRDWPDPRWLPLRTPLIASLAGGATILPFGYVAHRYLGDLVPFLVLGGAIGLQALLGGRLGYRGPRRRVVAGAVLVALAALTTWVNVGLALRFQRQWAPETPSELTAGFIGFQRDLANLLGAGSPSIEAGDELPDGVGRAGLLFVRGDCEALYHSDGMATNAVKRSPWSPIEVASGQGRVRARVRFDAARTGSVVEIATIGNPARPTAVTATWTDPSHLEFAYRSDGGMMIRDVPVRVEPGQHYLLDLTTDWRVEELTLMLDDVRVLAAFHLDRDDTVRFGSPGRGRSPTGMEVETLPLDTPLCRALLADFDDDRIEDRKG